MPKRGKSKPKTLVFGRDWIPISSRAGEDECCCLRCTGELVEIVPLFAVEVVRRFIRALRDISEPLKVVFDVGTEIEQRQSSESAEALEPLCKKLAEAVNEFESAVHKANVICDAILPWVVWLSSPDQRASEEKPVATDELIFALDVIEHLHTELMAGEDIDSGGGLWQSAESILEICVDAIARLQSSIKEDLRVSSALAGLDDCYVPKLRLTRVDPVEDWGFCSEECCRKYHEDQLQDADVNRPLPSLTPFTPLQRRIIQAVWELADWDAKPKPFADGMKVAVRVWNDEEKVSTSLRPALSKLSTRALEQGVRLELSYLSPNIFVSYLEE